MTDKEREDDVAREARIEREIVEAVFKAELDEPLTCIAGDNEVTYRYVHDGLPHYVEKPADRWAEGVDYITIIDDFCYGRIHETLYIGDRIYRLVASYLSSGATECPLAELDDEEAAVFGFDDECPYCGATDGEHGEAYLGPGWHEAVYRHGPADFRPFPLKWKQEQREVVDSYTDSRPDGGEVVACSQLSLRLAWVAAYTKIIDLFDADQEDRIRSVLRNWGVDVTQDDEVSVCGIRVTDDDEPDESKAWVVTIYWGRLAEDEA